MKTETQEKNRTRSKSWRRDAFLAALALTILWGGNLYLLHSGTDPVTGLRRDLARFSYNPDAAELVESESWFTAFGYEGRARFRFTDDSGIDIEVQGGRTLACFEWTIHSLISRGR